MAQPTCCYTKPRAGRFEGMRGIRMLEVFLLSMASGLAACASSQKAGDTAAEFPSAPFRLETAHWSEPYDGPLGYPEGAQRASVGVDARSGGETYYARFPAGSRFKLHWHAHGEYAVVLRGKVTHILGTARSALEVGDYVVIPPRTNHGWEVDPNADAFLLIRRDGPGDFNFVEP